MDDSNIVITNLKGYSGIRLKNNSPLTFKPGINLLVGRNGCGKTNLIRLIQNFSTGQADLTNRLESSFIIDFINSRHKRNSNLKVKKFGSGIIAKFSIKGKRGSLKFKLKDEHYDHIIRNAISDPSNLQGHCKLECDTFQLVFREIHGSFAPPKFEMSGYLNFDSLLSKEHGNTIHAMIEQPLTVVTKFLRTTLLDFFRSSDFVERISTLEKEVNELFTDFLGTTNKRIKLNLEGIGSSGRVELSVMDRNNYIKSADLSTGEAILLNLVFSLYSAKESSCDILCLDEPDIHLHEDMIQVLVEKLSDISRDLPNCIIIVASHSTVFIEKLASFFGSRLNIISFDGDKNVQNSKSDLELIHALKHNGVKFSPLMLTKPLNIFIENRYQKDDDKRILFSKFFAKENMPNIVPIGTSGNVQDSDSFAGVIQDILRTSHIKSVGIQDGDIWFKAKLVDYLLGKVDLDGLINTLKGQRGLYIQASVNSSNAYFFNLWEIENLYITSELLSCWQLKNGDSLTAESYLKILRKHKETICTEYFDTFFKYITRIRTNKTHSVAKRRSHLSKSFSSIESYIADEERLEIRMNQLIESILEQRLLDWVPGKEIKKLLESKGYLFTDDGFDYDSCNLTKQARFILYC